MARLAWARRRMSFHRYSPIVFLGLSACSYPVVGCDTVTCLVICAFQDCGCDPGQEEKNGSCVTADAGEGDSGYWREDSGSYATPEPYFSYWSIMCDSEECHWEVGARGAATPVTMTMTVVETGDVDYNCLVECDVWAEVNPLVVGPTEDYANIWLTAVDDPAEQVPGVSTLFDTRPELAGLSIYVEATTPDGTFCLVDGHNPGHFMTEGCETM